MSRTKVYSVNLYLKLKEKLSIVPVCCIAQDHSYQSRKCIPKPKFDEEPKCVKGGSKAKKPQKLIYLPAISKIQRRRNQKERLQKAIMKYEVKDKPKKHRSDVDNEDDQNIEMLLLAMDSISRCRGIVDEIFRPRPGVDLVSLRNFKYVMFEKAIGFVEEFNSIMKVLVKKIIKVEIGDTFSDKERLQNSDLIHSVLELV